MNTIQKRSIGVRGNRVGRASSRALIFGRSGDSEGSPVVSPQRAFSLIEIIGVLAVIGILAGAIVPALIRQMDKIAGDQESAALKSFSDALQQSIMRNRYIPTYTNWATNIATELGVDVSNVTTNARRQPRFFLIDTALRIGNNNSGLPYTQANWVSQTNSGSVVTNNGGVLIPPISPRVMMLSSIGRVLPASITNGAPTSANFNAIGDCNVAGV